MKRDISGKIKTELLSSSLFNQESLRTIAEKKAARKQSPESGELENIKPEDVKPEDVQRIIQELKVHQIELEMQNEELSRLQVELGEAQARYFDLFDMAPVGFLIISEQGIILEANLTAAQLLGSGRRDLINHRISSFIMKEDQNFYYSMRQLLYDNEQQQECDLRIIRRDQTVFWGHLIAALDDSIGIRNTRLVLSDISARKQDEQELMLSEEKYRLLCTSMDQGLALFEMVTDENGDPADFMFLDINDSFTKLFGASREHVIGKKARNLRPKIDQNLIDFMARVALSGEAEHLESDLGIPGRMFSLYGYSPKTNQFAALFSDITDRSLNEERINYLSYHDQLTGLYNRRFYEEEIKRLDTERDLPFSIAMGDVNGLKLVNDSFGHLAGDELIKKAAAVIKKGCRADDIIARFGGDEFIIILPRTDAAEAEKIIQRIRNLSVKEHIKDLTLSISFGYETKTNKDQDIMDVFKTAEDHMYRHKLAESSSARKRIIDMIINVLYKKNDREMQHSKRVSELCQAIAIEMNLDIEEIEQIRVAGLMHDIGKIGIDENILNSPHNLSKEDFSEMKRHAEIGYRILSSATEMAGIADCVLDHHERWDGKGYPKRLRGNDIPLASRIISLAEAFDTMTHESTYREVLCEEDAVSEIMKCSGKQFDPEIAAVFIKKVIRSEKIKNIGKDN